jgi:hypothetical protein
MSNTQAGPPTFTPADLAAYAAEVLTGSPRGRRWIATLAALGTASTSTGTMFTIDTPTGQRFQVTITEQGPLPG